MNIMPPDTENNLSSPMPQILVAGGSGLVGRALLQQLLARPNGHVTALLRQPLEWQHPRLTQRIIDFDELASLDLAPVDTVYCCLGSTMKAAGSKAAFRRVDHDYVLALARRALACGARQFLLVSSMGAHARSAFFYMRIKGETEQALRSLSYAALVFLRPAYLVGKRAHARPLEDAYGAWMLRLAWLMPRAYRPIAAEAVARALIAQADRALDGCHVLNSEQLQTYA